MRDLPDSLAARVGETTTLCRCWQLVLRDGSRLGFTDHDADLSFDGLVHAARSGFRPEDIEQTLGFATSTTQVGGALVHDALSEADLRSGRLDGARVTSLLVDWLATHARLIVDVSEIGTVRCADAGFVADLCSPAQRFDQPVGRLYQMACGADLGDARCRVDLAPHTRPAQILAGDSETSVEIATTGCEDGWFADGLVVRAQGARLRIRDHRAGPELDSLVLWSAPDPPLAPGEAVTLIAGCDKSHATCRARFANVVNFRGFPHMPGNDMVLAYAHADDVVMDGGSLFR